MDRKKVSRLGKLVVAMREGNLQSIEPIKVSTEADPAETSENTIDLKPKISRREVLNSYFPRKWY